MTIFDDNFQIFIKWKCLDFWKNFQIFWKSCDLTLDTWDTDYIADNWEQQYKQLLCDLWIKSDRDSICNSCNVFVFINRLFKLIFFHIHRIFSIDRIFPIDRILSIDRYFSINRIFAINRIFFISAYSEKKKIQKTDNLTV